MRAWWLGLFVLLASAHPALADEVAAPLPSKDMRWYASVGYAVDAGSLPRASPGLALGGGVRRGGLGASVVGTGFHAQVDRLAGGSGASVALYDVMGMLCAFGPLTKTLDLGACGGGGIGLLRASVTGLRPQGVAIARFDVALRPSLYLSTDAGVVVDPLRTHLEGDADRASFVAFRSSVGLHVRFW